MELNEKNIVDVFDYCLFEADECEPELIEKGVVGEARVSEGIGTSKVLFHPVRLKYSKGHVMGMLAQLPAGFMKAKGGGDVVEAAMFHGNGIKWTESKLLVHKLIMLTDALNLGWVIEHIGEKPAFVVNI